MKFKNEENILKIIKFSPPLIIIIISIIVTTFYYFEYKTNFEKEKRDIEKTFIDENKRYIKTQVDTIYDYIKRIQKSTEDELKKSIQHRVYEAHKIATKIYEENKNKPKKIVQKMIQDALVDIRFNNNRGYFFIYSFDYECILLPVARHLEGSSFYNFKDGKGMYLTREIIKMVKEKDEGFLSWWYHKPNDMIGQYRKIGFNKHFKPYNWFIGTGEYLDDFKDIIQERVLANIKELIFNKHGYIFILDYEGKYKNHINSDYIGKTPYETKNVDKEMVSELLKIRSEEGVYKSYVQKINPTTKESFAKKTSYIRTMDNWQWTIGMGFYQDKIKAEIIKKELELTSKFNSQLIEIAIMSFIFTILFLIASIKFSKILESKFYAYRREIEHHIATNTKQQTLLAQQSKMAAMGEMLGNIAHQWRQPLSTITAASANIRVQKELELLDDKELFHSLDGIEKSAKYLSKTIDDFRNFFNPDKERNRVNIKDIIEKTKNLLSLSLKSKDIELFICSDDVQILILENELTQVILNIINNARDELIKDMHTNRYIFIKAFQKGDVLTIEILDNAGGVPDSIIEKIFEPYFTTKHQSQGTGIGLYMAEEIITKHLKGNIEVKNKEFTHNNHKLYGANFKITLPIR